MRCTLRAKSASRTSKSALSANLWSLPSALNDMCSWRRSSRKFVLSKHSASSPNILQVKIWIRRQRVRLLIRLIIHLREQEILLEILMRKIKLTRLAHPKLLLRSLILSLRSLTCMSRKCQRARAVGRGFAVDASIMSLAAVTNLAASRARQKPTPRKVPPALSFDMSLLSIKESSSETESYKIWGLYLMTKRMAHMMPHKKRLGLGCSKAGSRAGANLRRSSSNAKRFK